MAVSFGNRQVSPADKTRLVQDVFATVAQRYDVMNDLMSLGTHRAFKRMTVEMSGLREGDAVLDLAGGTGDMSRLLAPIVGETGTVVLADLNRDMMQVGRDRLIDAGAAGVNFCQTPAERLPFADNTFACAIISFGFRNFTSKEQALLELLRVLQPQGVLLILEFSKPKDPVLTNLYSVFKSTWPALGQVLVGDRQPYEYLVESIDKHPNQEALALMMRDAGFDAVEYHDMLGGVAAIHRGVKS